MPSADAGCGVGALLAKLRARIERSGPIPVDQYMMACLADPEHGYWQKTETIGAAGDFITAPEISQVFGELIGLWCVTVWQGLGQPATLRLVELGPGRGTLMRDALRAARTVPPFLDAVSAHLIEVSAPLRAVQRRTLASSPRRDGSSPPCGEGLGGATTADVLGCRPPQPSPTRGEGDPPLLWHEALADVPEGPTIVIANEFLDALPIRQLVFDAGAWHERVVDVGPNGALRFAAGAGVADPAEGHPMPSPGTIVELRAAEEELLRHLAGRKEPLAALFIDYGPAEATTGDTLQAVRRHAYVDPLAEPGSADVTAHVRFARFARKARAAGLAADRLLTQAQFLGSLGIAERVARLMAGNPDQAAAIEAGVQRLLSPTGMGQLFKTLLVRSRSLPPPFPFV
jgi:NADH dehydrogenase [ubiquinone] 1 alpha subcomplex assembly factor 7